MATKPPVVRTQKENSNADDSLVRFVYSEEIRKLVVSLWITSSARLKRVSRRVGGHRVDDHHLCHVDKFIADQEYVKKLRESLMEEAQIEAEHAKTKDKKR